MDNWHTVHLTLSGGEGQEVANLHHLVENDSNLMTLAEFLPEDNNNEVDKEGKLPSDLEESILGDGASSLSERVP